jgi:energy-converting hydrogenase Eha subunit A
MIRRVVWTAVVASVLGIAAIVLAALGQDSLSLATGLAGVISALLASRESR